MMTRERRIIPEELWTEAKQLYIDKGMDACWRYLLSYGQDFTKDNLGHRLRKEGIASHQGGTGRKWTPMETALLTELWTNPRVSGKEIMEEFGRGYDTIRQKAASLGLKRGTNVSRSPFPRLYVPNVVSSRPVLVLADLHVPFQDGEWAERLLSLFQAWGGERVILAGDAIDAQDLSKFERFDRPTSKEEIEEWKRFEETLLRYAPNVTWFLGNHEARWGRLMDHRLPLADTIRGLFVDNRERVSVMESYAVTVNGEWRLEHPKGAGANIALDLVSHHLMNVAVAHTHHASTARDPSGRFFGVRIGAVADHGRMPYCTKITHGKWAMTNGGLILVPRPDGSMAHWNLEPEMDLHEMERMYQDVKWD